MSILKVTGRTVVAATALVQARWMCALTANAPLAILFQDTANALICTVTTTATTLFRIPRTAEPVDTIAVVHLLEAS